MDDVLGLLRFGLPAANRLRQCKKIEPFGETMQKHNITVRISVFSYDVFFCFQTGVGRVGLGLYFVPQVHLLTRNVVGSHMAVLEWVLLALHLWPIEQTLLLVLKIHGGLSLSGLWFDGAPKAIFSYFDAGSMDSNKKNDGVSIVQQVSSEYFI